MTNDITKCTNRVCPLKKGCKRYTIGASERQSYSLFQPTKKDGKVSCDYLLR